MRKDDEMVKVSTKDDSSDNLHLPKNVYIFFRAFFGEIKADYHLVIQGLMR